MKVKLLSDGAKVPQRATKCSAGYDLYVPKNTKINPGRNIVPLDICIELPTGFEGQIRPRSGFSAKGFEGVSANSTDLQRFDADVLLGTIDSDYRGCVGVLVKSYEQEPFTVLQGTRIAQLVIGAHGVMEMEITDTINDTERSDGGFGHTGTK